MDYIQFQFRISQLEGWDPNKYYLSKDFKLVNRPQTWLQKLIAFLFKPSEAKSLELALHRIKVIAMKNPILQRDLETSDRIMDLINLVELNNISKNFKKKFKESTEASCSYLKIWLEDDLENAKPIRQLPRNWRRYTHIDAASLIVRIRWSITDQSTGGDVTRALKLVQEIQQHFVPEGEDLTQEQQYIKAAYLRCCSILKPTSAGRVQEGQELVNKPVVTSRE
ncbi:MAG: hypothetical protein ACSNEK_06605 [Parachlamydiaceae bacterium]